MLEINNVRAQDGGEYVCTAFNFIQPTGGNIFKKLSKLQNSHSVLDEQLLYPKNSTLPISEHGTIRIDEKVEC